MLSSIFDDTIANMDVLTDRLVKKINGCVAVSFKKRRVCLNEKEDKLSPYDRLRELKGKDDEESKTELASVIKTIAENAEENFNKLKSELEAIKDDSGKLDAHKLWKLRKKDVS